MQFTYTPEHDKATEYTLIGDIQQHAAHDLTLSWPFQRPIKEITLVGLVNTEGNPPKGVTFIRESHSNRRAGFYSIIRTWPDVCPLARVTINNSTKRIVTTWEDTSLAVDLKIVCHVLIDTSEPANDPQPKDDGVRGKLQPEGSSLRTEC